MRRRTTTIAPPTNMLDVPKSLIEQELRRRQALGEMPRAEVRVSMSDFIAAAWRHVDARPFLPNWHVDAIADHMTAAFDRKIRKLIINIPPSYGKSLLVSVFAPAWQWGPNGKPQTRFICTSYADTVVDRDAINMRALVQHEWYAREWGNLFELAPDQNEKNYFKNTKMGHRVSIPLGGTIGGLRADVIIIDDPTNPTEAKSTAAILDAQDKWNLTLRSRALEDDSVVVLIMQRIHNDDLTGYFLNQGDEWTHLRLPALYEPAHKCRVFLKSNPEVPFFEDPRVEEDEALHPARVEATEDARRLKRADSWVFAGQYQQRPVPLEGGQIKHAWIQHFDPTLPVRSDVNALPDAWDEHLITVDCAFKAQEDNSWVVMQFWSRRQANAYLRDQVRGHFDFPETLINLLTFSMKHPEATAKYVEDKANGPAVVQMLKGKLPGLLSTTDDEEGPLSLKEFCKGSKEAKLAAVAPYFQARNIWIAPKDSLDPEGKAWVIDYLYELTNFPKTTHDDQVDATSMAVWKLLSQFAAHITVVDALADLGIAVPVAKTVEHVYHEEKTLGIADMGRSAFGGPGFDSGPNLGIVDIGRTAFGG